MYERLEVIMVGIDVYAGGFDALALGGELVETLLAATSNDDRGLGFEVMDSESERAAEAGSGPDDEHTLGILKTECWHGVGRGLGEMGGELGI